MTIIHAVLGKANPDRMNGVNRAVFALAKTQAELGHDVRLWGIANTLEHNYPPRPFRTVLFRQSAKGRRRLDPALAAAVDALPKGAVLHLHGAFIPEFRLLARRLRRRGVPYVFTPHGAFSEVAMQKGQWRKRLYFSLFERRLALGARAVHLLGEGEYGHLAKLLPKARKVLISNGIALSDLPDVGERARTEVLTFGFCGRLDAYYKGLDLLLEGLALFLRSGRTARLELIGDGPDRAALEARAAALGIGGQVAFLGAKYGPDKFRLMARCDVFVHTSRSEGFPVAVLEAAGLGLPCLVSEGTNMGGHVRRHGAGIAMEGPLTAASICEALETAAHFYEGNKLADMGGQARRMVQESFSWEVISERILLAYEGA
jgi:glycosyltransferase involved in cell wall biosynthesis